MNTTGRYRSIFPATIAFSVALMLIGVSMGHPEQILPGLWKIVTMQDLLITDYIDIAGPAAAFINAGLVTITSVCILKLAKDPFNGFTIVEMGLMAGFSLFGKNMFNIWPIILGTWLYARYQREPFSKYASVALLSTSLAPLVSYMALGSVHASLPLGILSGVAVGFLMPSLSAYTYKVQNGMNLYNMGFACGLFAMMVVDVGLMLTVAFVPSFLAALIACAASPWALALRPPGSRCRSSRRGMTALAEISHWCPLIFWVGRATISVVSSCLKC